MSERYLKQTQVHTKEIPGNCWATCLANLLGYNEVPPLDILSDDWWKQSEALALAKGFQLLEIPYNFMRIQGVHEVIVSGRSPRKNWEGKELNHCVLGKIISEGKTTRVEFLHDPHPDDTFIESVDWITFALPILKTPH